MSAQEHPQSGLDVAIVGFGPTGAVLANLLGARGWRIGVFDREPDLQDLPRAVHFDGEVMRIFHAAGLAGVLTPLIRPSAGMQYVNVALMSAVWPNRVGNGF